MPSLHATIKVLSLATSSPLSSTTRASPPLSLAPILPASDLKVASVFQLIARPVLTVFLPFLSQNPPLLLLASRYQAVATQDMGTATPMLGQTRQLAAVLEAMATPAVTTEQAARALTPIATKVARTVVRHSLVTATDSLSPNPTKVDGLNLNPSPLLHHRAPLQITA